MLSLLARTSAVRASLVSSRGIHSSAMLQAAGKAKKGAVEEAVVVEIFDTSKSSPVNFMKDGTDPPILPDDQYPEWLWNLKQEPYDKLEEKLDSLTYSNGGKRYFRLLARRRLRENNMKANML